MRYTAILAALVGGLVVVAQQPVSVNDNDASIVYEPAGAWQHVEHQDAGLYQNSYAHSSTEGATATFRFKGSQIEFWSVAPPQGGTCHFALDAGTTGVSSSMSSPIKPMEGHRAENLDPAVEHTFVLTVGPPEDSGCFLDRFVVFGVASDPKGDTGSSNTDETPVTSPSVDEPKPTSSNQNVAAATPSVTPSDSAHPPKGTGNDTHTNPTESSPPWGVIGGVIGAVVAIAAALLVAGLWWRRRQKNRGDGEKEPFLPRESSLGDPDSPRMVGTARSVSIVPGMISRPATLNGSAASTRSAYSGTAAASVDSHMPRNASATADDTESLYAPASPVQPELRPLADHIDHSPSSGNGAVPDSPTPTLLRRPSAANEPNVAQWTG